MQKEFTKMQMWNFVSYEKRMELVKEYSITPSAPREVANNVLVQDGIMEQDLELVPIEVLHEVTGIPAIKKERATRKKKEEVEVKKDEVKTDDKKVEDKSFKSTVKKFI